MEPDLNQPAPATLAHMPGNSRWQGSLLAVAIFALSILVFRQILTGSFINWDDLPLVVNNPRFLHPTLDGLRRFWTEYDKGFFALYTPLSYSAWWCIAWCFGVHSAAPFHTISVVLHGCNAVLVFMLLQRLLRNSFAADVATAGSALGACLYAVHPLQVEAVCWVSGFNNILATTFALYALVRLCDSVTAPSRSRAVWHYLFAMVGLLLALCAKPTAVVTPGLAAVICGVVLKQRWQKTLWLLVPWLVLLLPFIWVGQHVQDASYMSVPPQQRGIIVADTIGFYAGKLVVPYHLSPDYGRIPDVVLARVAKEPLWAITGMLAAAAVVLWRSFRWFGIACILSAIAISPVSGVTPFLFQSYSTVADRYMYFAMVGPALLLGALVCTWPRRRTVCGAAAILAVLAAVSFHQAIAWRSTYTWAQRILASNPKSLAGNLVMGGVLAHDGMLEDARRYFMVAKDTNPGHPRLLLQLAMFYLDTNEPHEALPLLLYLLEKSPQYREAYPIVGIAAVRSGTPELGIQAMERVVALRPNEAQAHAYLGAAYGYCGNYPKAYEHLDRALTLEPDNEEALRMMAKLYTELRARTVPVPAIPDHQPNLGKGDL
jgi:protein O-mannosyl-transferase